MAAAGVIGAGVTIGKSAIEITEQHATALGRLKQASEVTGTSFDANSKAVQDFIRTNQQFIPDNNKAVETFAMLLRSTGDYKAALDGLRVVMNLTAITGKDWDASTQAVNLGLQGSGRSLRELGIDIAALKKDTDLNTVANKDMAAAQKAVEAATKEHDTAERRLQEMMVQIGRPGHRATTEELMRLQDQQNKVNDSAGKLAEANKNLASAQDQVKNSSKLQAEVLEQLFQKTKDGAAQLSPLQRSINDLNGSWQTMAERIGPPLITGLTDLVRFINANVIPAANALGIIISQATGALPAAIANIKKQLDDAAGGVDAGAQLRATQAKYLKTGIWDYTASIPQWDPQYSRGSSTGPPSGPTVSTVGSTTQPAGSDPYKYGGIPGVTSTMPENPTVGTYLVPPAAQKIIDELRMSGTVTGRLELLLQKIVDNTKQKPAINVTQYISGGTDLSQVADSATRQLRGLLFP